MKIYKHQPIKAIRIMISRQGSETQYISLIETTIDESIETFMKWLHPYCDVFAKGKSTSIVVRECLGGKNGRSKSFRFYGLSPKDAYDILIDKINTHKQIKTWQQKKN